MSYGLIATLIVVAIVVGAITTKKCEAFLIAGSMVGAVVLWKQDFLSKWVSTLEGVMSDEAYVILICGLFGSLVALLTASKGSFGFICKTSGRIKQNRNFFYGRRRNLYCNSLRRSKKQTAFKGFDVELRADLPVQ